MHVSFTVAGVLSLNLNVVPIGCFLGVLARESFATLVPLRHFLWVWLTWVIDGFGGMQEAIAKAAELAHLGNERGVRYLEPPRSFRDQLID